MAADIEQSLPVTADTQTAEPRPWETADDARHWQNAGRVRTPAGGRPHITAVVELDGEQSDWVRREARRLRLTPVQLLKRLLDDARVSPTPGAKKSRS